MTKKKLKLFTPETTSHPYNLNFICNTEVVIQLERLNESVVVEMTAGGSALPPGQTKKKLKLSTLETTSHPSNPNFICNREVVIQLEILSESAVAEMTAGGSAPPRGQTKKVVIQLERLSESAVAEMTAGGSGPPRGQTKKVVIQLERLSESAVAEMTAGGSAPPRGQTKKVVIQLERLSESAVAEMTAGGSGPPRGQTKKVVIQLERLSESAVAELVAGGSAPPRGQTKKVVIQLERLSESAVAEMTAGGSAPPRGQTKKVVIQLERLSESAVAEMTAGGSAPPRGQTKKVVIQLERLSESAVAELVAGGSAPPRGQTKKVVIQLERLSESALAEITAGGSAPPRGQTKKKLKLSTPKTIVYKEVVIPLERLSESVVAKMTAVVSSLPPEQINETNDEALGINSLPDEIILKVFSYLTHNQLGQIARVCRRWNVLTKSPVLWRKVNVKIFSSFRQENTVTKSFINGLPSSVTFIRLDFSKCGKEDFEELCAKLHQNCPHLQDFILTNLTMSNLLPEVINFCTQFLQSVKKLVFHYCNFSKYSRTVELSYNSKIEVLDLCGCDFSHCCKTQFSKLIYLKELRLSATNVDDTWFEGDTSFLNQCHVLDLGWTEITASTFLEIQRHGHNLKELYLCYCSLKDHHLHFNNSVFPHLKTICLFYVSGFSVTCEGVVLLIQSCPSLQNVYVNRAVAESFAAHPFVVANRCKTGIVKAIDWSHNHIVNYLQN